MKKAEFLKALCLEGLPEGSRTVKKDTKGGFEVEASDVRSVPLLQAQMLEGLLRICLQHLPEDAEVPGSYRSVLESHVRAFYQGEIDTIRRSGMRPATIDLVQQTLQAKLDRIAELLA